MSKAFTPPDTLSKENIKTIADVRREIWTSGMTGLAIGSLTGLAFHVILRRPSGIRAFFRSRLGTGNTSATTATTPDYAQKNSLMLFVLLGGTMGSFLSALSAGKNQVHTLHPVFKIGSRDDGSGHSGRKDDLAMHEIGASKDSVEEVPQFQLKRNRILRHQSIQNSLESTARRRSGGSVNSMERHGEGG
jgi:hypothetical protein